MFKELSQIMGKATISLTIVKTDQNELTVSIVPKSEGTNIAPAVISGTPEELDEGFAGAISGLIQDAETLIIKKEAAAKSIKEEEKKASDSSKKSKDKTAVKSDKKEDKQQELIPETKKEEVMEEQKEQEIPVEEKAESNEANAEAVEQYDLFDLI